ncbi:hypothetical protein ITP53_29545 [Nonomuraea sp. K274]|uniref:Xaa-Pro dipeptidyl-peptidase C-terminal domain-containing protein n=1 Tax=Nonomuraea cypriaca TaxID=1187855 RepID=A0A931F356_9ACTN|nr:hypothetical protein [Nonomuraea cypriaca]
MFSEWYDEYFVPRGYAVVEAAVPGTGASEGCPTTGAQVTVQRQDGAWETSSDWPYEGTRPVRMWFGPATPTAAGTLRGTPAARDAAQSFTDDPAQTEATMIAAPEAAAPHRLAYLGEPLAEAVHLSGTAEVRVRVTSSSSSSPLTALLVDYGPATPQAAANASEDKPPPQVLPIVTRGSIDVKNRHSLTEPSPLRPGRTYPVRWRLHATDYVFPEGHRIGLVIVANDREYITPDPAAGSVTLDLAGSSLTLPL